MLLCTSHELITRPKNFIYPGNALGTVSHCCYGLHSTRLEYFAYASDMSSGQYGWMNLSIPLGRRAEDDFLTPCYLGRRGQHKYCAEQRSCTAWNVKADSFYGDGLLPAFHTRSYLYADAIELLSAMELLNVVVCQFK